MSIEATQSWDIIGDIHGYADQLRELLLALGYEPGACGFFHPEGRKALFLGDYIDRGPAIRETLKIVRQMVDSGNARALMGNHEFNALTFATPDGEGGWLRPHTPEKVELHRQTLLQLAEPFPGEWREWLDWFSTLPMFLDFGGLRAVHAAWNDDDVRIFSNVGALDATILRDLTDKQSPLFSRRERLLNGVEVCLPEGYFFSDKSGFRRDKIRVRWWEMLGVGGLQTYRDAVFPDSATVPGYPIPEDECTNVPYPVDAVPVFFGHYWLPSGSPRSPQRGNVACLDYSVAIGGMLTGYRWDGEQVLDPGKFVTAGIAGSRL
ncbi:MAG: metallophosphoesterase [Terrimicrobiaceae bacterium]|nr:metallophosphoesterase [Terrimicrobiaceae bacterium]